VTDVAADVDRPIRIGVSSCLLGNEVRYDGGHKRNRFVTDLLGSFVEWVPVCPEVEVGMDTPRPALRLVREDGGEVVRRAAITRAPCSATHRAVCARSGASNFAATC
jgi:uncharacterized protein YbbK (DUF523 family)